MGAGDTPRYCLEFECSFARLSGNKNAAEWSPAMAFANLVVNPPLRPKKNCIAPNESKPAEMSHFWP
jgi:hypothetical protein